MGDSLTVGLAVVAFFVSWYAISGVLDRLGIPKEYRPFAFTAVVLLVLVTTISIMLLRL